jgi:uncharacterized membrane protein YGL010W
MIDTPLPPDPLVQYWLQRHRGPTTFLLHMIGIPPTILGVLFVSIYLSLFSLAIFFLALTLFIGGFILQFAGHLLEGTDPGEVIYLKRKLGMPYVEFPPAQAMRRADPASGERELPA